MHKEIRLRLPNGNGSSETKHTASQSTVFWSPGALELVEFILRPPVGGPPILPEFTDAVLSLSLSLFAKLYYFQFICFMHLQRLNESTVALEDILACMCNLSS